MVRVAIIGATGYTGLESIKILLRHGRAELTYLSALPEECGPIGEIFPVLRDRLELPVEPLDLSKLAERADAVLCCLPHKVSMGYVPRMLEAGLKVVDFSADYRLRDVEVYRRFYQVEHSDRAHLSQAVFGLPELFRQQIRSARLVANPGCYPTCAVLGLAPLVSQKLVEPDGIIINAISGVSGAGRKPVLQYHYPEVNENGFAYAVGAHRHAPEIEQALSDVAGRPVTVLFQPHVVSVTRGMLVTSYARLVRPMQQGELEELYRSAYAGERFIRLPGRCPQIAAVAGTNFCDIHVARVAESAVVFSALDNLVKGAAGQAVQNLNLMFGLDETTGLR